VVTDEGRIEGIGQRRKVTKSRTIRLVRTAEIESDPVRQNRHAATAQHEERLRRPSWIDVFGDHFHEVNARQALDSQVDLRPPADPNA
jgi:hypothetical protein